MRFSRLYSSLPYNRAQPRMQWNRSKHGFTLIELLLVIAIMGVLGSIVFIALNPTKQLGKARDTQRLNDVNTILNAVYQYQVDMNIMPIGIPTGTPRLICKSDAPSCTNGVNLNVITASGVYLVRMPADPQATGTGTNYAIVQDSNRRITVSAPSAEQSTISVTR